MQRNWNPCVPLTGIWNVVAEKVQAIPMSISRWTDKQNVLYYNGILVDIKEKKFWYTLQRIRILRCYAKWNKPVMNGQILYDSAYDSLGS